MNLSFFLFRGTLERFRQYLDMIETSIKEKGKDFEKERNDRASKMNIDEKEEFLEYQSEEYWAYQEDYPQLLRKSIFIASFSFLEHNLIELCQRLKKQKKLPLNFHDIAGSGIIKAQTYLKKVVVMDFPDNSILWQDILIYQQIRNLIVHNDSSLRKSKEMENIINFIHQRPGMIKLDHLRRIVLERNFCLEVLKAIEEFFSIVTVGMSSKEYKKQLLENYRGID